MHKVKDAKGLRCMVVGGVNSCVANGCGHWLTIVEEERKTLKRSNPTLIYNGGLPAISDEDWVKTVEKYIHDECWEIVSDTPKFDIAGSYTVKLKRQLKPDEQIGRCGLIQDHEVIATYD